MPRSELVRYLRTELLVRFGPTLPGSSPATPLGELLQQVGTLRHAQDPAEPQRVLAGLPLPLFITANADPWDAVSYMAQGMNGVVEKPIKAERLMVAINEALDTERRAVAA